MCQECQLELLKERIQQSMKSLPRQKPYTWKSVQGCAVIGPDMLWYRGELLEVLGGHVKVGKKLYSRGGRYGKIFINIKISKYFLK